MAPNKHLPLSRNDKEEFEKALSAKPATRKPTPASPQRSVPHAPNHASPASGQSVDGTVARQLRRGRAQIDARVDLHGMRQGEAHSVLNNFILRSRDRGARCVLVITGKGSVKSAGHSNPYETPGPGVLRVRLRQWMAQEPLVRICYGIEEAHPRHGGSGAFYVFIRKNH